MRGGSEGSCPGVGDVRRVGLLISFQSKGKAEGILGTSFKIHTQSASLRVKDFQREREVPSWHSLLTSTSPI